MIKITSCLFTVFLIASVISCSGGSGRKDSVGYLSEGKYNFIMYDSSGEKTAEGILNVKSFSEIKINGNYSFTKVYNEFAGYESMSKGEFTGKVNNKEKSVLIDTNPLIADNNVFFNLKIGESSLEGDWYYTYSRRVTASCRVKLSKNQ